MLVVVVVVVAGETLPRDQQAMLAAMDLRWIGLPPTLKTLQRPGRYLQRCSLLSQASTGNLRCNVIHRILSFRLHSFSVSGRIMVAC